MSKTVKMVNGKIANKPIEINEFENVEIELISKALTEIKTDIETTTENHKGKQRVSRKMRIEWLTKPMQTDLILKYKTEIEHIDDFFNGIIFKYEIPKLNYFNDKKGLIELLYNLNALHIGVWNGKQYYYISSLATKLIGIARVKDSPAVLRKQYLLNVMCHNKKMIRQSNMNTLKWLKELEEKMKNNKIEYGKINKHRRFIEARNRYYKATVKQHNENYIDDKDELLHSTNAFERADKTTVYKYTHKRKKGDEGKNKLVAFDNLIQRNIECSGISKLNKEGIPKYALVFNYYDFNNTLIKAKAKDIYKFLLEFAELLGFKYVKLKIVHFNKIKTFDIESLKTELSEGSGKVVNPIEVKNYKLIQILNIK